jgi:hypothetical protein
MSSGEGPRPFLSASVDVSNLVMGKRPAYRDNDKFPTRLPSIRV